MYYNATSDTRIKRDASHEDLGTTLEQRSDFGEWVPKFFTSRYPKIQEKKSINEEELLANVWTTDRFKHYIMGKKPLLQTIKLIINIISKQG